MSIDVFMSDLNLDVKDYDETEELYVHSYQKSAVSASSVAESAMKVDDDIADDLELFPDSNDEDSNKSSDEESARIDETLEEAHTRNPHAAVTSMTRQQRSNIPDLLIHYDQYEFCSVEAGKTESNNAKQKNDSSKSLVNCKQMLLNLSYHAPSLQQDISIIGMGIGGMKLTIYELSNSKGMVCVNKKVN
ncbi:hypothetical protein INT47_005018 [Mucor saturninus]|uniref:Uncharacterized protein n=1 Tax=Mucor saturninus TaxID=64648 RepID=A0A8H7UVE6_9FUNG|nr:hypothetical protein INT47_005018 [Mucor saturninus]